MIQDVHSLSPVSGGCWDMSGFGELCPPAVTMAALSLILLKLLKFSVTLVLHVERASSLLVFSSRENFWLETILLTMLA